MSGFRTVSIFRAATTLGGATLLSRITGFVRDVMLAAILGAGAYADIFVVAFRLPNLFRRLFAEGAFSAAFVPLYAECVAEGGAAAGRKFAGGIFWVLVPLLALFTILALIFMPYLVAVIAAGLTQHPARFDAAIYYARLAFPYLACMSLLALFAAMLNASGRFLVGALAPVLLNLVLLGAMVLAYAVGGFPLDYIIFGVVVAGVLQMAWGAVAAYRADLRLDLRANPFTPELARFGGLVWPGVLAAGVGQINLLIGTSIATFQQGAAAWLYYADRLYQLPMGVIGVALGVALLPDLSRRLVAQDEAGAGRSLDRAILAAMLLTLPSAFGLYALAEPIVRVLFERGAFLPSDSLATARAIQIFCFGLPAFVLIKLLQTAFFARQDTRAPLLDGAVGVACNIALSLWFFAEYGHIAIAFATAVAGWVTVALMVMRLAWRGVWHMRKSLAWRLIRQLGASAAMLACLLAWQEYWAFDAMAGFFAQLIWVVAYIIGGAGVYGVGALGLSPRRGLADLFAVKRDIG